MTKVIGNVVLWGFALYGAYTAWQEHSDLRKRAGVNDKKNPSDN